MGNTPGDGPERAEGDGPGEAPSELDEVGSRRFEGQHRGAREAATLLTLIANAVGFAQGRAKDGQAQRVDVVLYRDGTVSVMDDSEPVAPACVASVFTGPPRTPGDVPAPGATIEALRIDADPTWLGALCTSLEVEVCVEGARHLQRFAGGVVATPMTRCGPAGRRGMALHFRPDPAIFTEAERPSFFAVVARLRETAALDPRLDLHVEDRAEGLSARLRYPQGLRHYVEECDQGAPALHPATLHVHGQRGDDHVELAFRARPDGERVVHAFADGRRARRGGTHLRAFDEVLGELLARVAARSGLAWPREYPPGLAPPAAGGVTLALAVRLARGAAWREAIGDELTSPEAAALVREVAGRALHEFFTQHPDVARELARRACDAYGWSA